MSIPAHPEVGTMLYLSCINCDSEGVRQVSGAKVNAKNPDGSTCYVIRFSCAECGYINGSLRPIWYNLYSTGVIVGYGFDIEKTLKFYSHQGVGAES